MLKIFDRVGALRGNVQNMYRAFAHRPEILRTVVARMNAVINTGTVSARTKELWKGSAGSDKGSWQLYTHRCDYVPTDW